MRVFCFKLFVIIYIDKSRNFAIIINMAGVEKIIEKFRRSRFGHTFEDCKKVLEYLGFCEKSSKGSHHKFVRPGFNRPFILAKHRPIDPAAIVEILDFYDKELNNG